MMWYYSGGVPWWGWLLGSLGMVAFWAVLAGVVWYLCLSGAPRRIGRVPQEPGRAGDVGARRILDERLARGEIDTEQYRRLRDALEGRTGPSPTGDRSGALP